MLPREIEANQSADEVRFDLPQRPIGPVRLVGLVPMGFAVLFAWMPGTQILRFLQQMHAGKGSAMEWFFIAFLLIFVLAALMPFGFGLFILAGRTRVTLRKDCMVVTELAGPARWSRRMKFDMIERLEISGAASTGGRPAGTLSALCGVAAIFKNGRKTPVAVGYPRDWLQPLLDEMIDWMKMRGVEVPVSEGTPHKSDETQTVQTEVLIEKPPGSRIELSRTNWGVEFNVPSRGLFKESYGMFGTGMGWCLLIGGLLVFLSARGIGHGPKPLFVWLAAFWLMGLAILLLGLHLGTRRWALRADHSQLHVTMKSVLRSREWKWAASAIEDVRVGDSNTSVNHQQLEQLQILTRPGSVKTGLLTGRTHDELAWMATALRSAVGAQPANSTEAPPRIGRTNLQG